MSAVQSRSSVLQACLAKAQGLAGLVEYADDSIVSKTILDKPAGTITLFAFDKGQKLSEHTAPYDAVVQVIDGKACLIIGGERKEVSAGQIVIMPGNVPHAVIANERFKMLLIMIRAAESETDSSRRRAEPEPDQRFWKPQDIFEVDCPACGAAVEFFKDEPAVKCHVCGCPVRKPKIDAGCLRWCRYAGECCSAI